MRAVSDGPHCSSRKPLDNSSILRMDEARLEEGQSGFEPAGDGWFVVNVRDSAWRTSDAFGSATRLEGGDAPFAQLGINIRVLHPGEPNCLYHRESLQEDFLVLHGECLLLVEGEERRLRAWDFVHVPPGTDHVFVGAGDGPCAILMVGARRPDATIHYPVNELAARYGASAAEPTSVPAEAYADWSSQLTPTRLPWPP
jgi:uncharacterized cupin superfamily protein